MNIENIDYNTGERISIEFGTQLQIEIEGIEYRFKSVLIGMEPDEYLIIKISMVPSDVPFGSIKHKLFRGSQILVRYLYKGTVFGFQSKLIEAIYTPIKLLFVEYPKIIEHYDLRSQARMDCLLPAKIKIKDEEKHGVILDISKKGCRYRIKKVMDEKLPSIKIDEQITLRCQFPGIEDEHLVSGKVKNISRDKQEMTLGIEFHEIVPELQSIIEQYISTVKEIS